jgi:hypothetical protein
MTNSYDNRALMSTQGWIARYSCLNILGSSPHFVCFSLVYSLHNHCFRIVSESPILPFHMTASIIPEALGTSYCTDLVDVPINEARDMLWKSARVPRKRPVEGCR